MELKDIIGLVANGKLTEAEKKLTEALDTRRDALLQVGREHIAASIVPHA